MRDGRLCVRAACECSFGWAHGSQWLFQPLRVQPILPVWQLNKDPAGALIYATRLQNKGKVLQVVMCV